MSSLPAHSQINMFLNVKFLTIIFSHLLLVDSDFHFHEKIYPYEIQFEKGCLVLKDNALALDTLCSNTFKGDGICKNLFVDSESEFAIKIQLRSRGIGNFSGFNYIVEKWGVKDDKFYLESSLAIRLRNCDAKRVRIELTKDGVRWRYKNGFLRKSIKCLIPYLKLEELSEYHLPCS